MRIRLISLVRLIRPEFLIPYLVVLVLFKFGVKPSLEGLFFLIGGLSGGAFLNLAEVVLKGNPPAKTYKNVLFQVSLIFLSLFVLTSSASFFGKGLILGLGLNIIVEQAQELKKTGSLTSWFSVIKKPIRKETQKGYFLIAFIVFFFLTILFLL